MDLFPLLTILGALSTAEASTAEFYLPTTLRRGFSQMKKCGLWQSFSKNTNPPPASPLPYSLNPFELIEIEIIVNIELRCKD